MKVNIRDVIRDRGYAVGTFVANFSPSMAEVLGIGGMDFLILDTEHGPMDYQSVENMIRSCELNGVTAIVRLPQLDNKQIGRLFDIGAHGVQMPMIHTAELAREVVRAVKYPPHGNRGIGIGRGAKWGTTPDFYNLSDRESFIVCMCESQEAVDNIEDICKTDMVDAVFIGTVDLSQSLGCPGQPDDPRVEACVQKVLKACRENGVIAGITASSKEAAKERVAQGFQYITVLNEMRLVLNAAREITGYIHK